MAPTPPPPPLPPVAPPNPPPSPTQTVVVNLPPELVHKLSEPSSFFWLTPLATVLAGLLALAGAAVAYRAVKRQINANAQNVQDQIDASTRDVRDQIEANTRTVQDQIDAAAAEQQKNREAEWARLRRREVLDLLEEARLTARKLASIAKDYCLVAENPELFNSPEDQRLKERQPVEFAKIYPSVPILMDKLEMHELTAVSESLSELEIEAGEHIREEIDHGEWTIPEKEQAVFDAIKEALREPPS